MPWKRAQLRGQRVFVKALPSGELAAEEGRVEVRYKANDGRSYRAGVRNLEAIEAELLPEDTCGAAEAAAPKADAGAGANSTESTVSGEKKTSDKAGKKVATPHKAIVEGAVVAYTDGACSGNPGPAGSGMLLQWQTQKAEGYTYLGTATNNVAELTAIQEALRAVPNETPIVVHTDSQYAIGVLQKGWKAKANQDLIANIRGLIKARSSVQLLYVRGHAGDPGNERADELARAAIQVRSSKSLPTPFPPIPPP
jgi:ribonuclease HI